jgi:hypothetical protein
MINRSPRGAALSLALSLAVAALAACDDAPAPAPLAPPPPAAVAPPPAPTDDRDQYQLARDIDAALHASQQASQQDGAPTLARTVRAWVDKRISWELRYVPLLCQRPDECFMTPFDHNRFEKRLAQGWLPRLELDAATHADVARRCQGNARCVVRVEARIKTLVISPDDPTSITLDRVALAGARGEREGESWVVSKARGRGPARPKG